MKEVWKCDLNYHKICSTFVFLNFLAAPHFFSPLLDVQKSDKTLFLLFAISLDNFLMTIGERTCKLKTLPCTAVVQILIANSNANSPAESCPKKC